MALGGIKDSKLWAQVGFYSSLGLVLPAGAVTGYGIGWLVDRWLHTAPVIAIVLAFLGGVGGFIEVLKILTRAEKDADRNNSGTGES